MDLKNQVNRMHWLALGGYSKIKEQIFLILCSILLITPIAIQTFPATPLRFQYWIAVALFLLYVLGIKRIAKGFEVGRFGIALVFIYLILNVYGLSITEGSWPALVKKEIVWGGVLLFSGYAVLSMISDKEFCLRFVRVTNSIFTVFAGVVIILSLVKFLAWSDGIEIQWYLSSGVSYPIGSSLVGDINFFSLTMFILSMAMLYNLRTSQSNWAILVLGCMVFCLMFLGFSSGSRRFFILANVIFPLYCCLIISRQLSYNKLFCFSLDAFWALGHFDSSVAVYFSNFFNSKKTLNDYSYANTFATVISEEVSYGFQSRLVRLSFGMSMIDINTFTLGSGFDYVSDFGCKFLKCLSDDYPHLPVFSGLLSSGVAGFISCAALLAYAFIVGVRLILSSKNQIEWGASLIFTVIFVSISGNTLFSMPVFFVVLIYGLCACRVADRVG